MFPAVEDVNSKLIYIFVDPHGSAGKSANESFVIADSFLTACSQLGKGSGIGWPKWWNQVAHSLYRCLSCYFDKDSHPILWSLVDRASCNVFYTLSHERRCCGFHFHAISPQVLWWGKGGAPLFNVLLLLVLSRAHLLVHPAAPLRHRQVGEGSGLRKGNTATTAQLSWRIFWSLAYKTWAWDLSRPSRSEVVKFYSWCRNFFRKQRENQCTYWVLRTI